MTLQLVTDNTDERELESWFAASVANYVTDMGSKPSAAILLMIDGDGTSVLTHMNTMRTDLAMAGARLIREATDD